jgi:hypothetical protein
LVKRRCARVGSAVGQTAKELADGLANRVILAPVHWITFLLGGIAAVQQPDGGKPVVESV